MLNIAVVTWMIIMTLIASIPLVMLKCGNRMTGRDLFFVFIGVVIEGSFNLVLLFTK